MRRRLPINDRVVRQLFPDNDVTRQYNNDNLANMVQETIASDHEVMKERWNFDFRNEVPLPGVYEWIKSDSINDWIGVKASNNTKSVKSHQEIEEKENESDINMRMKQEKTPKGDKKVNMPGIRKRKTSLCLVGDPVARRKISFD